MMKFYIHLFYLLLTYLLSQAAQAEESRHWPVHVSLNQETKILRAGQSGILQRLEDGLLVIDFGRNGIHEVPKDSTDFSTKYEKIKKGELEKDFPNYSGQIASRLVAFPNRTKTHITLEDHVNKGYYLTYYPGKYTPQNALATQAINKASKQHTGTQFLALPKDMNWYPHFINSVGNLAVFVPHLSGPYRKAFHHKPNPEPSFVITDANGKMLYRSETLLVEAKTNRRATNQRREGNLKQEIQKAIEQIQANQKAN